MPTVQKDTLPNVVPNYELDNEETDLIGPGVDQLNKENAAAHPELIDPTKPLTLENLKVTNEVSTVDALKGLKVMKADALIAPASKQSWMWDDKTGSSSAPDNQFSTLYNSQWKRPELIYKWQIP